MSPNQPLPTDSNSRQRRRWFRFSLRTFFIIVTAVCIASGLYVKRERDRYLAIETIKAWGNFVDFVLPTSGYRNFADLDLGPGKPRAEFPEEQPTGPPFMRRMLGKYGKYHGSNVVSITLGRNVITPKDAVFDVDVLAPLNEVQRLSLGDGFSDDAVARLPGLPELEHLQLHMLFDEIGDHGLQCLSRLPNLQSLLVGYGSFSEKGLAHLRSNQKLTRLWLHGCELQDAGLVHLASLPLLNDLLLTASTVTDAAIPHLSQLGSLKNLELDDTNMTLEGVERLREALPNCRIEATFNNPGESRASILRERERRSSEANDAAAEDAPGRAEAQTP